jgi:hypothetical protein
MEGTLRKDEILDSYRLLYGNIDGFNGYCFVRPVCSSMKAVAMLINEMQSSIKSNIKDGGSSVMMPAISLYAFKQKA